MVGLGLPVNGILSMMSSPFSYVETSLNLGGTLILGGAKSKKKGQIIKGYKTNIC